ncbi:hypothetical protein E1269_21755 [Jiangella asiatica]|uniref:Uncharacterized protein n=1 Tax=Jiangella asiatica TaxID=2530372 RepID=A0A4R5CX78_9ACTN|nr:hypothetical protein E1269_21755 [Jiangella asiatica]
MGPREVPARRREQQQAADTQRDQRLSRAASRGAGCAHRSQGECQTTPPGAENGSKRSSFSTTICVLEALLARERARGVPPDVTEARPRGRNTSWIAGCSGGSRPVERSSAIVGSAPA